MFSISRIALAGTAAAAVALAGAAPGMAQEASADLSVQAQTEVAPVTDQEIETFVDATIEIQTIIQQWQPKLEAAQDKETAQSINTEMQAELVAAVKDEGMSPQRYNEINILAARDPELAGRIEAVIEES